METIDSVETSAATPPVGKWQFSLREIVLATVAIAAIIALVMQNQPRKISSMAQQFDPHATLNRIIKDNNLPGQLLGVGGAGGGRLDSMITWAEKVRLSGVPVTDVNSVVMPALMDEMKTAIAGEGYGFRSSSTRGSRNKKTQEWDKLSYFSLGYKGLRISGRLRVFSTFHRSGDPMLIIFLDEE